MAFCKNCGTQIADNATFCANCGASANAQPQQAAPQYAPQPQYVAAQPVYVAQPAPVMGAPVGNGLGKAITACILGVLGVVFGYLAYYFVLEAELSGGYYSYYYYYYSSVTFEDLILPYVFFCAALPLSIVGVTLGAKSIGAFKAYKQQTGGNAIGTLICGIAGIVEGAAGIILAVTSLIYSFSIL